MNRTTSYHPALTRRPRRNRQSPALRALVQETELTKGDLVAPLFLIEGSALQEPIASMPGIYRYTLDEAIRRTEELAEMGIFAIDLFAVTPSHKKNPTGEYALDENNLLNRSIAAIKKAVPETCVMVDIALDPYTSHGHDGVLNHLNQIDNDKTLMQLAKMSLLAAKAGADVVAPSDMMDGRVAIIRDMLDEHHFTETAILSYTAKYASAYYTPFRDALESAPKFGDKKSYQLNPANIKEALLEADLDEEEGADMLLVKPALAYLDVLTKIVERTSLPVGAYHVSGEYAQVMAAAEKGWLDADRVFLESLLSIKRAGASFIFTYAIDQVQKYL